MMAGAWPPSAAGRPTEPELTPRGPGSTSDRTVGIVQARMTSTRFPGKVLADLVGAPMIERQWQRLERAMGMDALVLATSVDASDDELVHWATGAGIAVVRGPLDDVLARFVLAAKETEADIVVRLTADCPLACPEVIDRVIERFHADHADYCSNTLVPTFPDGVDVEVVRARVLREVAQISTDPPEREHVTLGVYRRPDHYRLVNVADATDRSDLRWTVDTPDDLAFVQAVYERLGPHGEPFTFADILDLLEKDPELSRRGRRNAALDGLDTGAMQHRAEQHRADDVTES